MKNWQIIGLLAIVIIGIVLMSGCITKARSSTAITPLTPEIVYVSGTVTPTSTIARAQNPIIGVWRLLSSSGSDDRYRFNADGTYVESMYVPSTQETYVFYGTWSTQGSNSYALRETATGSTATIIYNPARNVIYDTKYTSLLLTLYLGDVASASAPTITSQPKLSGTQLASYTGDFGFDPTTGIVYSFKGDVSINSGTYNSVQVIIRYPNSQTYNYDAGPMGGSNPTIKPFFIFPDTRYKNDEPTFYIQLDKNKYTMTQGQNEIRNSRRYVTCIAYQN